jgi:hypothetical protein
MFTIQAIQAKDQIVGYVAPVILPAWAKQVSDDGSNPWELRVVAIRVDWPRAAKETLTARAALFRHTDEPHCELAQFAGAPTAFVPGARAAFSIAKRGQSFHIAVQWS